MLYPCDEITSPAHIKETYPHFWVFICIKIPLNVFKGLWSKAVLLERDWLDWTHGRMVEYSYYRSYVPLLCKTRSRKKIGCLLLRHRFLTICEGVCAALHQKCSNWRGCKAFLVPVATLWCLSEMQFFFWPCVKLLNCRSEQMIWTPLIP